MFLLRSFAATTGFLILFTTTFAQVEHDDPRGIHLGSDSEVIEFQVLEMDLETEPEPIDTANLYQPQDPELGFNLVSYLDRKPDEHLDYWLAMSELDQAGVGHVNIVVFRRLNADGTIDETSGSTWRNIIRAVGYAKALNMKVTLTPIFETMEESGWRGDWNPTDRTIRRNFYSAWFRHVFQLARIAQFRKVDRLDVGSEMVSFVNNPTNERFLNTLLRKTGKIYRGELGYNANWDNLSSPQVEKLFWNHPRINKLSVSMYPYMRLASTEESELSHLEPEAFAHLVQSRWKAIVEDELLPYAATLKEGQGMPLVIGEFGAVPYDGCAATPADFQPSDVVDVEEQEAVIMGLIRAVDQQGDLMPEITLWQWGLGDLQDNFGLNPYRGDEELQSTAAVIATYLESMSVCE